MFDRLRSAPSRRERHLGAAPAVVLDVDDLEQRVCPLCTDMGGYDHIEQRAPVDPWSIDRKTRGEYWRGFRSQSCFFDYARCPNCGVLYCPAYFNDRVLGELYASMPDNTAEASPDVLRLTQRSYIEFLRQHAPLRGTYLEIGPDIGLATEAAVADGHLECLVLVEPNRAVHGELRAAAGSVPAEVAASLDELASSVRANVAVLVHVLDHLVDPVAYLAELRQYLVPQGHVLIVVHNEGSLLRRLLGRRWPPFCLQHPQVFSPETLEATVRAAGYEVVARRPTTNVFPLRHVVKTGAALVGMDGNWIDRLPGVRVHLRLGNLMLVARA